MDRYQEPQLLGDTLFFAIRLKVTCQTSGTPGHGQSVIAGRPRCDCSNSSTCSPKRRAAIDRHLRECGLIQKGASFRKMASRAREAWGAVYHPTRINKLTVMARPCAGLAADDADGIRIAAWQFSSWVCEKPPFDGPQRGRTGRSVATCGDDRSQAGGPTRAPNLWSIDDVWPR